MALVQFGSNFGAEIGEAMSLEAPVQCAVARCLRKGAIWVKDHSHFSKLRVLNFWGFSSSPVDRLFLVT
jgi:hypothetical protein